ncbi:hypothetical protein RJ640_015483 [Escallonia rubra]|uniref:Uncharacterized protein n=1 Tax=Escallonia rubra TaxID=112253 RepID=A0AA88RTN0_9ASTE|nr:hypothetical protein RJ640_015483 [Escallonia rubra]
MAALSIGHSFHSRYNSTPHLQDKSNSRVLFSVSCQSHVPINRPSPETKRVGEKEKKANILQVVIGIEKLGKGLRDSLSPKRKGDWKDLVLMSLSFAVYVYISQKIVCAYCVWTSMLKQPCLSQPTGPQNPSDDV